MADGVFIVDELPGGNGAADGFHLRGDCLFIGRLLICLQRIKMVSLLAVGDFEKFFLPERSHPAF